MRAGEITDYMARRFCVCAEMRTDWPTWNEDTGYCLDAPLEVQ